MVSIKQPSLGMSTKTPGEPQHSTLVPPRRPWPSAPGHTHPLPGVRSEVTPRRDTAPLASQEPCGVLNIASRGKALTLCN